MAKVLDLVKLTKCSVEDYSSISVIEAATPYVYDKFIGAWGMFSHHDQVPLYFTKHIYA